MHIEMFLSPSCWTTPTCGFALVDGTMNSPFVGNLLASVRFAQQQHTLSPLWPLQFTISFIATSSANSEPHSKNTMVTFWSPKKVRGTPFLKFNRPGPPKNKRIVSRQSCETPSAMGFNRLRLTIVRVNQKSSHARARAGKSNTLQ